MDRADASDLVDLMDLVDLDPDSSVAPFQQVRDQIAAAIDNGVLLPAVRLPPVRQLAADLGLAVNTVARSYRELELAGRLETRGRHGTFVAGAPSPTRKLAARQAEKFVRHLRQLGIGDEETLAIVGRAVDRIGASKPPRRRAAP
jgi:DNA-binding transcriptional regulator YhcF (GntR family)